MQVSICLHNVISNCHIIMVHGESVVGIPRFFRVQERTDRFGAAAAGCLVICTTNTLGMTAFTVLYQEGVDSQWRSVAASAVQVAFTFGRFFLGLDEGRLIVSAGYRAYRLSIVCAMRVGGVVAANLYQKPDENSLHGEGRIGEQKLA